MSYENLPMGLLRLVTPQQVRSYALAKGWERIHKVNGQVALFHRPGSEFDQLIVPMEASAPDYARRIADVVMILMEVEHRALTEILGDLLLPDADIVRYRIMSPDAEKGTLPLQEGLRLLEGAKRSILAAACSVLAPVNYHPRMTRTEAVQLLDACELGQTERGSFTVAIACPLRAVEQDQLLVKGTSPFTRRTTTLLMRSARKLVSAIEADLVPTVYQSELGEPVLSANLLDALLRMQPQQDRSSLALSASWASVLPEPEDPAVPTTVNFRREYFPIIEDVCRKLRPSQEPTSSLFVGFVDALNGAPAEDGRMQGETTFLLMQHEEETIRARADLGPEDYQTAIDAHRHAGFVKFRGVLHLGHRIHRITDIGAFQRVEK